MGMLLVPAPARAMARRAWELVVVHGGGTDQDAVLVLYIVAHLKAGLVQPGQTGAGDLVQSLNAIHIENLF